MRRWRRVVIGNRAPGGAVEVVILIGLERPHEAREAEQAKEQGERHKIDQHFHQGVSRTVCARNALAITRMDEPDIASAAISGVTYPMIASGTAIAL